MAPYIIRCPQISGYIHEKIVGTLDTETNGGGRPGQCKQLDIYVKRGAYMKTDRAFCLGVAQLNREWWQKYICWWLPKKGWSESMMTDVHGGYPAVCNAGDARPVHHIVVHLLGQAVLALPEKMQGSMSWYQMQVQRLMFDAWGQRGLIT